MKKSYISKSLFRPPHYAHIAQARARDIFFSAGAVPLDGDGALVGDADIALQARTVVQNLQTVLGEQGLTLAEVVKLNVYVVGDTAALGVAWNELVRLQLANDTIAATLVGVASLGYPGQLIEIEVVAVKDAETRR